MSARVDRNDLAFWLPKLERVGVPVPRTTIVRAGGSVVEIVYGPGAPETPHFEPLVAELRKAADAYGYPCFLRTGHGSGKHEWERTCFVPDGEAIRQHAMALIEWCEVVDMIGLPTETWAVREFLPLVTSFRAFDGRMPINKERRYFIDGGKVLCHHSYWPRFALEGHVPADVTDWAYRLEELNAETRDEVAHLTAMSQEVSRAFDGAWSLDWAATTDPKRPWVAIDMAVASDSFHWPECPNSKQKPPRAPLTPAERDEVAGAILNPAVVT